MAVGNEVRDYEAQLGSSCIGHGLDYTFRLGQYVFEIRDTWRCLGKRLRSLFIRCTRRKGGVRYPFSNSAKSTKKRARAAQQSRFPALALNTKGRGRRVAQKQLSAAVLQEARREAVPLAGFAVLCRTQQGGAPALRTIKWPPCPALQPQFTYPSSIVVTSRYANATPRSEVGQWSSV